MSHLRNADASARTEAQATKPLVTSENRKVAESQTAGRFEFERAIRDDQRLPVEAQRLGLILASFMDAKTGVGYPGKAKLCHAMRYSSPESLKRPRAALTRAGYLTTRWDRRTLRTYYSARLPIREVTSELLLDESEGARSYSSVTFKSSSSATHKQSVSNNHLKDLSNGCSSSDSRAVFGGGVEVSTPPHPLGQNLALPGATEWRPFRAKVTRFLEDGEWLASDENILTQGQEDALLAADCQVVRIGALA